MSIRTLIITVCLFSFTALTARTPADSISVDTLLMDDGSLYMGQIRDSLFNGHGVCIYIDGTVYEGNWKDGLWDGKGTVVYPDGDIYKGNFRNHIKEGKGTYIYNSGARYDGEWKNDMFNGSGKLVFSDGGMYDGAWKDDMKHGYGRLTSYNGRSATGFFYYDEFLGLPYDTEINQDSTLTEELQKWGFQHEKYHPKANISIGLSYGSKDIATLSLWFEYDEHYYYGLSMGIRMEPPTRGTPVSLGWHSHSRDVHFIGEYISSQYLMDVGYVNKRFSIGGAFGVGLTSLYQNCRANSSLEQIDYQHYGVKYGEPYNRRYTNGHTLVYRGSVKYSIIKKKQPKAQLYLGYGNADGLFIGVGRILLQ